MEKEPIKEKKLPPCEIRIRCRECLFRALCLDEEELELLKEKEKSDLSKSINC